MKRIIFFIVFALTGCVTAQKPVVTDTPLVGSWEWTRSYNNCRELYIFQENGESIVISGNRRFRDVFSVSPEPNEFGLYKVSFSTTYNSTGTDCTGSSKDWAGEGYVTYVRFNSSFNEMLIFYDPEGTKGFGPLTRVSN